MAQDDLPAGGAGAADGAAANEIEHRAARGLAGLGRLCQPLSSRAADRSGHLVERELVQRMDGGNNRPLGIERERKAPLSHEYSRHTRLLRPRHAIDGPGEPAGLCGGMRGGAGGLPDPHCLRVSRVLVGIAHPLDHAQPPLLEHLHESRHAGVEAKERVDLEHLASLEPKRVAAAAVHVVGVGNHRVQPVITPGQFQHDKDTVAFPLRGHQRGALQKTGRRGGQRQQGRDPQGTLEKITSI